jgi:release factor glutamine methyltransferase
MNQPALQEAADIGAARRIVTRILEMAGKDSPALDARLLVGHAVGLDHTAMARQPERPLSDEQKRVLSGLVGRRLAGEPVSRILGVWEFWGLTLALSPSTLVPRPDTETVVELALAAIDQSGPRDRPLWILDLGTGTGALLLALLNECREAIGIGTDLDPQAAKLARANAAALGLGARAQFIVTNYGAGLGRAFDLVVSNPPYIPSRDIEHLEPEVRDHDPKLALDGGNDGLSAYRAIAAAAPDLLRHDGQLVLEIGTGQSSYVEGILAAQGFTLAARRSDLGGVTRALTFRRTDEARAAGSP